ncbi:IgA peptidase M64-domain-containing protein [Mycena rebaudengoi]|nr:IgA peptidase M64-domain-containing protein [Mycena rebaudengoi]
MRLLLLLTLGLTGCAFSGSKFTENTRIGPGKCVSDRDGRHVDNYIESTPPPLLDTTQTRFQWPKDPHGEFEGVPSPPLEIQPLVVSGPSNNRVDLVFFSDGYLPEEHRKFIEDATRLANDISGNQTFNTVKPLMNFWAAFTPSKESGVGTGGKPKDTAFGLYRDGTELRGVYYAKPKVAGAACSSMGDQCDYPILLGNDPLYGGLGGRYTVVTASLDNGPLVLRHELGHSIIKVGEEYDGGFAYFGPNAHANLSDPVPWAHWLSEPARPRVERSVMPLQDYPWTLLNTSTPWSVTFASSGAYARHLLRRTLRVDLDGAALAWAPRPGIGVDRWHYDIHGDSGLSPGSHTLTFSLLNKDRAGTAQLCNAEILEFGDESDYSFDNTTTYRPTNNDCLMRTVTVPNFCGACLEGLWLQLLRRISLIDGIDASCPRHLDANTTLTLRLVPVAQFRTTAVAGLDESYTITWARDGAVLQQWANHTRVDARPGTYTVRVKYTTSEVRVDRDDLLSASMEYTVSEECSTRKMIDD